MSAAQRNTSLAVLAIDTALNACSVAVTRGADVLFTETLEMERGQAEVLVPRIEAAMAAAGTGFGDLDLIGVTVGPGAFTGIRIGLAAARGFAVATGLPVSGVTTLEALAAAARAGAEGRAVLAAVDTKRRDLFVQGFGAGGEALTEAAVSAPDVLAECAAAIEGPILLCGDAAGPVSEILRAGGRDVAISGTGPWPDPAVVAAIAAARAGTSGVLPPEPLYLRPPLATLPKDGGRLRPKAGA